MFGRRKGGGSEAAISKVEVSAFKIPTDKPEQDGTAEWDHTTLVVVEVTAGGKKGLGYTYSDVATARLIDGVLRDAVEGQDAFSPPLVLREMMHKVRNHGREGVGALAMSAVNCAMWDLKARLLGVPLVTLLGQTREYAEVYGSGGFTNYSDGELQGQLEEWREQGFRHAKIKIGRDAQADERRVKLARRVLGDDIELFVDANGAYDRKLALRMARVFAEVSVRWYEEPVSSDDLEGLRLLRDQAPPSLDITAGEYGWHPIYFRRMLEAGAVDVMMADLTRCLGVDGFMSAAAMCDAFTTPLSAHCAPAEHVHVCCAIQRYRHMEYFHDHRRIEHMLFEGAPVPRESRLYPDLSRPGMGLELRRKDAERYAV